jgi:cytochrome c556
MPKPARSLLIPLFLGLAGAVAAAEVTDPVVQDRVQLMRGMAEATKALGEMARGQSAFDANAAAEAIGKLAGQAGLIAPRFEPPAQDPNSKARAGIWSNWGDFTAHADRLYDAAMQAEVGSLEALTASLPAVMAACKSCHQSYRD